MGLYLNIASLLFCVSILGGLLFIVKNKRIILIIILVICIFFTYTKCLDKKYDRAFTDVGKNTKLTIKIISNKEIGDYYNKYVGKVEKGKYKNQKLLIYVKDEKEFKYGDILEILGKISKPSKARNKNSFDYSKYLKEKKICATIILENYQNIDVEKDLFYYIYNLKEILLTRVDKMYENNEIGFINAILFGKTDELEDEIRENFKLSNLSHVLAISGMHVSYIVVGLEKVLKLFVKNIRLRNVCIIIFLILFIPFVGGSTSVSRACIMTIIAYLAKILLEKDDFYSSFCIALFILLVINPYNINSISMWLSFGGSIGIVSFNKFLNKIFIKKLYNKIIKKIMEIAIISISAQIIIFPIMLYYFNTISLTFWISNVLISELIGPILILGYLSVILYPIGVLLSYIEKIFLQIIFFVAYICTRIPFNQIFLPTPKLFVIIIYYGLIFAFVYEFNRKKIYYLRKFLDKNYIIRCVKKIFIAIILISILLTFINYIPKDLRINFLDVGQGDCTLVRTVHNKVILIDSGEGNSDKYDYGKNVVFPYLLDEGILKIDYMIISHFDSDHARTECFIY